MIENQTSVSQIIIYTKRIEEMLAFYKLYSGFTALTREDDRIMELTHPSHGFRILLHPMGKTYRREKLRKAGFRCTKCRIILRTSTSKRLSFWANS